MIREVVVRQSAVVVASLRRGNQVEAPCCGTWFPRSRIFSKQFCLHWKPNALRVCPECDTDTEACEWDWRDRNGHRIHFLTLMRKRRKVP